MKKHLIVIGMMLMLLVVGLSGCTDNQSDVFISAEIIDYEIKDNNGFAVVVVDVSGNSNLEIVLTREKTEICCKTVLKRQVEDGSELVSLEMCNHQYQTPEGGNYEISIYCEGEYITKRMFYCADAFVEITYFHPSFKTYYSINERIVDEITLTCANIGSVPAYVSQIYLDGVMDSSYKNVGESSRYIGSGESITLSGSTYLESTYYADDIISVYLLDSTGEIISLPYTYYE